MGVTICEDAWNDQALLAYRASSARSYREAGGPMPRYRANPVAEVVARKIDLLVNVSGSPFAISKRKARPEMFAEIAARHEFPLAFVNQVGGYDELLFDGRSTLFGKDGTCWRAPPLSPKTWSSAISSGAVPWRPISNPTKKRRTAPS